MVDTAPAFDEQMLTALDETDECVIVATLDVPTLKNVKVALETLDMLNIARDHRHLLLNRADDEVGLVADKVEAILGMEVATQIATSHGHRRRDQRRAPDPHRQPRPPVERRHPRAGRSASPASRWRRRRDVAAASPTPTSRTSGRRFRIRR